MNVLFMIQSFLLVNFWLLCILREVNAFTTPFSSMMRLQTMVTSYAETQKQPPHEWDVDRYQQQHRFVWEYGASLLELVQQLISESRSERGNSHERILLDVGCGTGELTDKLSRLVTSTSTTPTTTTSSWRVIGIDSDKNMIAQAQKQFPDLQFVQGDIRSFDFDGFSIGSQKNDNVSESDEGRVDVIFSNAALHWVPPADVERAVQCMSQTLKRDGCFVAEFGGKGNIEKIVQAMQAVLCERYEIDCTNPWYFPSIANFTSLLEKYGIEVTMAELYDRPTILEEGKNGMENWIRMFGAHFVEKVVTEEEKQIFVGHVQDRLRASMFDGEDWTADYRRIRLIGRKVTGNLSEAYDK